jgi:SulP family sulfate permease
MIGQSVINVSSGARGVFLLFLIVVLGPYVAQIPMAALVAVMIMVSIHTFQWRSIKSLLGARCRREAVRGQGQE